MGYKFREHIADVKFVVEEKDLEKTFIEASKALKESIVGKRKIRKEDLRKIEIKGASLENLLYLFLEEFLYLIDAEFFIFSSVKSIEINEKNKILVAEIYGDDSSKYNFVNDVKAITYSEMKIEKTEKGFKASVVLDV